jgi:hypothetical protein
VVGSYLCQTVDPSCFMDMPFWIQVTTIELPP